MSQTPLYICPDKFTHFSDAPSDNGLPAWVMHGLRPPAASRVRSEEAPCIRFDWRPSCVDGCSAAMPVHARAQCRVQGTVQWADSTPAAGITISIPELKLELKTDERGNFAFDDIKAGIRITVDAKLDGRLIGRAYTLVTFWVEQVDIPPRRHTVQPDASAATACGPSPCSSGSRAGCGIAWL